MTTLPVDHLHLIRSIVLLLILVTPGLSRAQFLYKTNNGAITITGYNGTGGAVAIPTTINGYAVVQIATNSFASKTSITSINVPSSITNIGVGAFASCTSLTSITVDPGNQQYASSAGVLFNKEQP